MNDGENRKRIQELRWIGFQKLLTGIVLIFASGVFCFIFLSESADSHWHSGGSYVRGRRFLLLIPAYGLWNIVRGVIYLIRAQSGNEHFAKSVEDAMDKYEREQDEVMSKKTANGSMHNVLVLLVWVFLFLVVVGAIAIGYLLWTRPR